jgi:ribose-phosphate pyrophosphokinase
MCQPARAYNPAMKLFALNASAGLGQRIADQLGRPLDPHEEREFAHGEHKARPLTGVCGEDVYVVASLHGDRDYSVNDKICRLAFFAGALKDAGARRLTAVLPYFAYSRKDRRTKPHDPVSTRYLATMLQSVGVDCIVTMDVHNPAALDNGFRGPAINIDTRRLLAEHFSRSVGDSVDSILAPDLGGIKATRLFVDTYRELSGRTLPMAVMDKRRSEGLVTGSGLIGQAGNHVLIVDDMIGSGTTLCRATAACLEAGASRVSVGATHGLFENGAPKLFEQAGIDSITVTDTVAIENLGLPDAHRARITVIGAAPLFADQLRDLFASSGSR